MSRASNAALRFIRDGSWAMFCPLFTRLTVVDSAATAASCIGSLLRSPSLYSNSSVADSGSGFGGIADDGSGFLVAVPVVMAKLLVLLLLLELGGLLPE